MARILSFTAGQHVENKKIDTAQNIKIPPMLRQYLTVKEEYQDVILLYRIGDFYETFFDDAVVVAKILGLNFVSYGGKRIPLCGFPFHAVVQNIGKLVRAGYRVAQCDEGNNGKMKVVRVVSSGNQVTALRKKHEVAG